jgi:hypothetical protein
LEKIPYLQCGNLLVYSNTNQHFGLVEFFTIFCKKYPHSKIVSTLQHLTTPLSPYEINLLAVSSSILTGGGFSDLKTLFTNLQLPSLSEPTYTKLAKYVYQSSTILA